MWSRSLRLLLSLAVLFAIAAVDFPRGVEAQDRPEVISDLLVNVEWLAERLDDPSIVVLHVARDEDQYLEGHVPGARFVRVGDLVESREDALNVLPEVEHLETVFSEAGVSNDDHVIVYGDLGGLSAARAFLTLDLLGHEHVSVLDGGFEAWLTAGYDVSTEPSDPEPAAYTGSLRTDRLVDADWISLRLDDPDVTPLDARPIAQYTGEEPGADIERPGHIPGAVHLFWEEALVSEDNPVLHDDEVLRVLYQEVGITPEQTIVTYCRTGIQASHAYFVARYLGYEPLLYDPSYFNWSNHTDYPVNTIE